MPRLPLFDFLVRTFEYADEKEQANQADENKDSDCVPAHLPLVPANAAVLPVIFPRGVFNFN
jgi:hypothetical protein